MDDDKTTPHYSNDMIIYTLRNPANQKAAFLSLDHSLACVQSRLDLFFQGHDLGEFSACADWLEILHQTAKRPSVVIEHETTDFSGIESRMADIGRALLRQGHPLKNFKIPGRPMRPDAAIGEAAALKRRNKLKKELCSATKKAARLIEEVKNSEDALRRKETAFRKQASGEKLEGLEDDYVRFPEVLEREKLEFSALKAAWEVQAERQRLAECALTALEELNRAN